MNKLVIFAVLILTACGTALPPKPETPAQAVYLAQGDYDVALVAAVKYKNLPDCSVQNHPVLCSDAKVVSKVQEVANGAWLALQSAQTTVRDPKFSSSDMDKAVLSAQNAVGAFSAIVKTLKTE